MKDKEIELFSNTWWKLTIVQMALIGATIQIMKYRYDNFDSLMICIPVILMCILDGVKNYFKRNS